MGDDFSIDTSDMASLPLGDGLVIARHGKQGVLLLNSTARLVWELLSSGLSRSETAQVISKHYGVEAEIVRRDIDLLAESWISAIRAAGDSDADVITDSIEPTGPTKVLDCIIHNRSFRFLISDTALQEEVSIRFAPHAVSALDRPQHVFELGRNEEGYIVRNGRQVHRGTEVTQARIGLMQEVMSACFPGKRFIAALHAGAVYRDDACLLLAAASGGGKSTLIAALSAVGYSVLSDDLVFLDNEKLEVSGIPLGIMLRSGSWKVLEPLLPSLEQVSAQMRFGEPVRYFHPPGETVPDALKPSALVFLEFVPEEQLHLSRLDPFEALVRLNETRSWLETEPPYVQRFVSWIETISCWKVRYGDLEKALGAIEQLISR